MKDQAFRGLLPKLLTNIKFMDKVYGPIEAYGMTAARILIGLLFVFSGATIIMMGVGGTAGMIEAKGIPAAAALAWLVVVVKIAAGGMLMVGYRTREAALVLIAFTVIATLLFHMNLQDINLFKNLAIVGGLLCVISHLQYAPARAERHDEMTSPAMAI